MSYLINSRLLDVDFRKGHIQALLDLHLKGADISRSPVVDWAHRAIEQGCWWYGCEDKKGEELEACIQKRQQDIIALFYSILNNGYNGSTISIYFDKLTGEVHTYDGYHRLSIMDFLGLSADVPCKVSYHHPDPNQRGDFPLVEQLKELNGGEFLYEPCEDPRVSSWSVWRPDSERRLKAFQDELVGPSVLDVGCSCGWFSRQLARAGYEVTSLEANFKRLAVARYLSIIQNLFIRNVQGRWQNLNKSYDSILMLSVLHHDFLSQGVDRTFQDLRVLRGRCRRLVVELPLAADSVAWLPAEKRGAWSFSLEELLGRFEESTAMGVRHITQVHPQRPIVVLEA